MASIYEAAKAIKRLANNIEHQCKECLSNNQDVVRDCIQEQLYSGLDGTEHLLKPTYDDDPFFDEEGPWKGNSIRYKEWKKKITPPVQSYLLNFPARPDEVPNLFITGTFYDSIHTKPTANGVDVITSGFTDGSEIVRKYGEDILLPGPRAREYLVLNIIKPWLLRYMKECGIK